MRLQFIGGVDSVTGSCFYLEINNKRLLVDCGMHQGQGSDIANRAPFVFKPTELDYVLLTHAHIDHSGLLPCLVRDGFRGDILCTPATKELTSVMLKDSAHLQKKDAEWLTKRRQRAGVDDIIEPLYTTQEVDLVLPHLRGISYDSVQPIGSGVKIRFIDAGHILGSATIEVSYQDSEREKRLVFSGDIGKRNNPIIKDPIPPEEADIVLIESTYGNRTHRNPNDSMEEFIDTIRSTFKRGGNVLIPSFAVGRTQDILYVLNEIAGDRIKEPFYIFVDSPLAKEATEIYLRHPECFDEEALRVLSVREKMFSRAIFTSSVEESQQINKVRSGAIIIAGSGMCEGGRIRHHFKHNLWRKECSVVFVGFQAKGTMGRRIIEGAKKLKILGEDIAVKASVHTIGGFSAHADRSGLLQWLKEIDNKPKVFVVHGEPETSQLFAESIREDLGLAVCIPKRGDIFNE